MAVNAETKSVKVVLKLAKGSQTISGCKLDASDESLHQVGKAVSQLVGQSAESITKVTESTLVEL